MVYAAWQDNQPDNQYDNCLALQGDAAQWNDRACTERFAYICETGNLIKIDKYDNNNEGHDEDDDYEENKDDSAQRGQ